MNIITLDIETISTDRAEVRDYIADNIKPPATHKKAETIAAWYRDSAPEAIEEAVSKTSLDGAFGRICVVGIAHGLEAPAKAFYGFDEALLLNQLNDELNTIPANMFSATTVVGHNVLSFDLRFLLQRYIVNGIKPHPIIATTVNSKAWDNRVFDTMIQFAGFGNKISLDKLCLALSIPSPKNGIDGSKVGQFVADGRIAEVAEYCKKDCIATREAYKKMTFQ